MNEQDIRRQFRKAYAAVHKVPPPFDAVWANATAQRASMRRRKRLAGSIAAALAVIAVTAILWPSQQEEMADDYLIAGSLMNSTSWPAPSDVLLPEHQFDIY